MGKGVGFLMAVFVVCVLCVSEAAVYQVGDEQGWMEYVNYTEWTASKTFSCSSMTRSGRMHVMMVSLDDFRSCSSSRPIRIYQTGLDKFISVKRRAHLYFICGFPDHCLRGHKVDVRVIERPALPPQTTTRPSSDTQLLSSNSSTPPPQTTTRPSSDTQLLSSNSSTPPPQTTTRPSSDTQLLSSNSSTPPPHPGPSKQGPSPSPVRATALARGAGASVVPRVWEAQTLGFVAFVVAIA